MTIGQRLKVVLLERGVSQFDLARETGIDAADISRIVRGKIIPSQITIERICDALDIGEERLKEDAPSPDRHGLWVRRGYSAGKMWTLVCGNCGKSQAGRNGTPYCPWCGSKMEEE